MGERGDSGGGAAAVEAYHSPASVAERRRASRGTWSVSGSARGPARTPVNTTSTNKHTRAHDEALQRSMPMLRDEFVRFVQFGPGAELGCKFNVAISNISVAMNDGTPAP